KCQPEPVEITDDEFASSVERLVQGFADIDAIFQAKKQTLNIVRPNVQIHFSTVFETRPSPFGQHDLAIPKAERRPIHHAVPRVRGTQLEADRHVPLNGFADIRNMNHWNDLLHMPSPS